MTPDCVISVRSGRPCFVGFHAITGTVRPLIDLAARLPAGWGALVCSSELQEPGAIPGTVPELAAAYVDILGDRVAGAPLVLGGWGFGASVAVEALRLLAARGQPPAAMFAVGSFIPPPEYRSRPHDLETLAPQYVRHLASWDEKTPPPGSLDQSAGLAAGALAALRSIGLGQDTDEAQIDRALRRFQRHVMAFHNYDPAPVDGRVLVLYPAADPHAHVMAAGWERVAPQHERGEIPGTHLSVMVPSHGAAIAAALAPLFASVA